jgi:hypothetical protein
MFLLVNPAYIREGKEPQQGGVIRDEADRVTYGIVFEALNINV